MENYPGFNAISGAELGEKLINHTLELGAEIELDVITGIRDMGAFKMVQGEHAEYQARAVIIAADSHHRQLGLPRENELTGRGVCYCALCDGAFFKGREIAVIGGGNTALQDAVLLSELCSKVTVIQNLASCIGEAKLVEILKKKDNVDFRFNTVVEELVGEEELNAIVIRDTVSGKNEQFPVAGIFVAIGQVPENEPFAGVCKLNDFGYIEAGEDTLTASKGVFAAGDCRAKTIRQVTTAAADGAIAALAACNYIG